MFNRYFNPVIILVFFIVIGQSCKKESESRPANSFFASVALLNRCDITFTSTIDNFDTGYVSQGFYVATYPNPTADDFELFIGGPPTPVLNYAFKVFTFTFEDNVTYYVRPFVRYNSGISYGAEASFIINNSDTLPRPPLINVVELPGHNGASNEFVPYLLNEGGSHITKRGWVASEQPNPTIDNATIKTEETPFDYCDTSFGRLTNVGLNFNENVTYHVRAYAQNQTDIGYSEDFTFRYIDPSLLSFNFQRGVPVDTVLVERIVTSEMFSPSMEITNGLQLPAGIDMYIKIIEVRGSVNSSLGIPHTGDVFRIGNEQVYFEAEAIPGDQAPFQSYCKFSVKLMGITDDADYYCKYKVDRIIFNTMLAYRIFTAPPVYGRCPL